MTARPGELATQTESEPEVTSLDFTASQAARKATLEALGAAEGGTWMTWPTATALVDLDHGVVLIATELEPSPEDWESVCNLLELAGYDSGGRWAADPGEPRELAGLATWSLSLRVPVA